MNFCKICMDKSFIIYAGIFHLKTKIVMFHCVITNKTIVSKLHSKNAGLLQPNFGSNMDKPICWVKNVFKKCNLMAGLVHI